MSIFSKKEKKEPQNLEEILNVFRGLEGRVKKLERISEEIIEKNKFSVQKIGIVRYNPFSDVGGDQSFSLALLDENNNGVVITSLFTRDDNRVYGKAINKGLSKHSLSKEESKAINQAIGNNESQTNNVK